MLKKNKTNMLKQKTEDLRVRLAAEVAKADDLIKTTGMPMTAPTPPDAVLENLSAECQDHQFWMNFKKAAPMLFCAAMEADN